jgi:uncharacterized membrane protein YqhA
MVSDTVYTKIVLDIISIIISFYFDGHIANGDVMITLEAVDTVMIATLVKMIITGSYHSFVDKNHGQPNESSSWDA